MPSLADQAHTAIIAVISAAAAPPARGQVNIVVGGIRRLLAFDRQLGLWIEGSAEWAPHNAVGADGPSIGSTVGGQAGTYVAGQPPVSGRIRVSITGTFRRPLEEAARRALEFCPDDEGWEVAIVESLDGWEAVVVGPKLDTNDTWQRIAPTSWTHSNGMYYRREFKGIEQDPVAVGNALEELFRCLERHSVKV